MTLFPESDTIRNGVEQEELKPWTSCDKSPRRLTALARQ
jgi:hypothetical protein